MASAISKQDPCPVQKGDCHATRRLRFGKLPGLRFFSVEQSKDSGRGGASQEVSDEKNPEIQPRR